MMKKRIGLAGFEKQNWLSVNRTLDFFLSILVKEFEIVHIDPSNKDWYLLKFDAVINMNSAQGWKFKKHPDYPIIYIMNGGLVLDQKFLSEHLKNVETSDAVIVNCDSDISILKEMIVGKLPRIIKLPLPVDVNTFKSENKIHSRKQLPIKKVDYIMGYVGRILPQKNLHVFLRTLADLKNILYPKTIIGIINGKFWGDYPILPYVTDSYPKNIQNLINTLNLKENCFYFPETLSDKELSIFYNAMDFLLHPSHSLDENFGYVPIEAMACGIPPIGTSYGGLKDSIIHGKTGFLSPSWVTRGGIRSDIRSFVIHSMNLLNNKTIYSTIAKAAQKRVNLFYTKEKIAPLLVSSINSIIKNRKNNYKSKLKLTSKKLFFQKPSILPKIDTPWEHYYNVVSHYVSHKKPPIRNTSYIRLAAPIINIGKQRIKLLDDAWPAEYFVEEEKQKALNNINGDISVSKLTKYRTFNIKEIKEMLNDGIFVVSNVKG